MFVMILKTEKRINIASSDVFYMDYSSYVRRHIRKPYEITHVIICMLYSSTLRLVLAELLVFHFFSLFVFVLRKLCPLVIDNIMKKLAKKQKAMKKKII